MKYWLLVLIVFLITLEFGGRLKEWKLSTERVFAFNGVAYRCEVLR